MFKALVLSLALASGLHATVNGTTPIQNLDTGIHSPSLIPVGTPVYALNQALTGVASAAIDLSGTSGLWISVTSTGAANVTVYFSNSNVSSTGGAISSYSINSNGAYSVEPKARYVSFYNSSNQASNKVSVNYYPVVTSAGTVSIPGSLTANQGAACSGCAPWPVNDTATASLLNTANGLLGTGNGSTSALSVNFLTYYGWVTTTASGAAANGGSITAVALTGTVLTNIGTAAGATCPCQVLIEPGTGPNAGFYWGILPTSTWVSPVSYLAVSTTPILVTVGRGAYLQLSATAAAVTVNARVSYAPIN